MRQSGEKLVFHPVDPLVLRFAGCDFGAVSLDPRAHRGCGGDMSALAKQIDEYRNLRTQDIRVERLDHEVDGARSVGPAHLVRLDVERRQEDDRRRGPELVLSDATCHLEPVEDRHLGIENHDRELARPHQRQRLGSRTGPHDVDVGPGQHRFQRREIGRHIIHGQDIDRDVRNGGGQRHGRPLAAVGPTLV